MRTTVNTAEIKDQEAARQKATCPFADWSELYADDIAAGEEPDAVHGERGSLILSNQGSPEHPPLPRGLYLVLEDRAARHLRYAAVGAS